MAERRVTLANGYQVWTNQIGGGPGAGHDYLEPLEAFARDRPVIFYDQLGCGKSDKPDNRALWTIERFADEVQEVRGAWA